MERPYSACCSGPQAAKVWALLGTTDRRVAWKDERTERKAEEMAPGGVGAYGGYFQGHHGIENPML